jgi:PEP-CTERM motif
LTITLTDLQANPKDVAQLLSDLSFTLGGGNLMGATLASSSGQEVTVANDGSFTLGSTVSTGWAFSISAGTGTLDVLGTPTGPSHLIIGPPGPGGYTDANGSIAGNKPHNPFLNESATFTITGAGITDATTVTSATFSFGTTPGITVGGVVPEPSSLVLGLAGIGVVACARLYRSRRKA